MFVTAGGTTVLCDLDDLPTSGPLVLHGQGHAGEIVYGAVQALRPGQEVGVTHLRHTGGWNGLEIRGPDAAAPWRDAGTLVICSEDFEPVAAAYRERGWSRIVSADAFYRGFRRFGWPPRIDGDASLHDSKQRAPAHAGQAAALGARVLAEVDVSQGCERIRRIAEEEGICFPFDDVTKSAFLEVGKFAPLADLLNRAVRAGHFEDGERDREKSDAVARDVGPILVNTMIKSGTGFLTQAIRTHLNLPQYFISVGGSPNVFIVEEILARFARGGALSVQHLDPSEETLGALHRHGVRKIYVQVRDPRQATVSYLHHVENNLKEGLRPLRHWVQPHLPSDYETYDWRQKVAWQAKNHFPGLTVWVQEWVDAAANDERFEIVIEDFADFAADERASVNGLLRFFGIDRPIDADAIQRKEAAPHFRAGRTDEWRDVFDTRQIERMNALIPDALFERFRWER